MKVYKDQDFSKWQKKNSLTNQQLINAIKEIENGLYEAKLGDLYKKRIAKSGMGKSSGFRAIIACKVGIAWFYIYGFGKNEKDNIDLKTRVALKRYVDSFLLPNIEKLIIAGEVIEVK
jgi:hypothetical protein